MRMSELTALLPEHYVKAIGAAPIWNGDGLPSACESGGCGDFVRRVADAWQRLEPAERSLLRLVVSHFGAQPFSDDKLLAAAAMCGIPGIEARMSERKLLRLGVLFAVRRTFGDSLLFLPSDLYPAWLHAVLSPDLSPLPEAEGKRVLTEGGYRPPFGVQLAAMLASLSAHGMSFTAKGTLSRKAVSRSSVRLSLGDEDLAGLPVSTAHSDLYPKSMAIGLDVCCTLSLLRESSRSLELDGSALRSWLAQTAAVRESELIRRLTERLSAAYPPVMQAAAVLAGLPAGVWFRAAELSAWLAAECGSGAPGPEERAAAAGKAAAGWMDAMRGFGWMQLGEAPDGSRVFRWLYAPVTSADIGMEEAEPIRVLPNGDIVVPPEADLNIRWEIEAAAEPVHPNERMAVYRLTAGSIARAIEQGRSCGTIIGMLEAGSGGPLPAAAAAAVAGWAGKAGRVTLTEPLLLVCASEEVADRLAADPSVSPLLTERIGCRHFTAAKESAAVLRKRLRQAGYPPLRDGGGDDRQSVNPDAPGGDEDARPDDRPELDLSPGLSSAAAFVYGCEPLKHFAPDTELISETDSLLAPIAGLPASWTKDLRSYHHSTKRDMLEEAIRLGLPVVLEAGGQPAAFVPERIDGRADGWRVSGRYRHTGEQRWLTPDMWGGMMLQVPDIQLK